GDGGPSVEDVISTVRRNTATTPAKAQSEAAHRNDRGPAGRRKGQTGGLRWPPNARLSYAGKKNAPWPARPWTGETQNKSQPEAGAPPGAAKTAGNCSMRQTGDREPTRWGAQGNGCRG